jgi:hypothetical protein
VSYGGTNARTTVRSVRSLVTGALLAAAWLPAVAAAQAYQVQPQQASDGWRAWLFSTTPATAERRLDLGVLPDDRSSRVAAFVTYPVVGGMHAGVRLDGTIDGAGARANTALLVLRVPLFGTPETPARAAPTGPTFASRSVARSPAADRPEEPTAPEGMLARFFDPTFYWQALRLNVPMRWLMGEEEAPSAVELPPIRLSLPSL